MNLEVVVMYLRGKSCYRFLYLFRKSFEAIGGYVTTQRDTAEVKCTIILHHLHTFFQIFIFSNYANTKKLIDSIKWISA